MSMQITWDVSHASALLDRIINKMSNGSVSQFFDTTVEGFLHDRARARFQSEGDDASGGWVSLEESTIEQRIEAGFGAGPINKRTGEMEDWMTSARSRTVPTGEGVDMFFPGTDVQGELGLKLVTARGDRTTKYGVKIPARPVVAANETDMNYVIRAFHTHLEGAGIS